MRQAGQIEAFGYHKYYRAIFLDAQELSVISFIFVTYVKMLCKQHYVNFVYWAFIRLFYSHIWCGVANSAPHIEKPHFSPVSSTFLLHFRKNIG